MASAVPSSDREETWPGCACLPGTLTRVFSTLIGGRGYYAITPVDAFTWGGYYAPRALVWNSRWVTTRGIVESR